ncbi:unnamed protein product, partial [Prorocentrum cordatum]
LLFDEPEIIAEARALALHSVACAAWFQDAKLAQLLRADTAAGATHLRIHNNRASLVDRNPFEAEHSAMQLQDIKRIILPVVTGLVSINPGLVAGRKEPRPRADAASHDFMQYLHERAEALAERWAPSVFFGNDVDNQKGWMDWCVSCVTAALKRPQFDANFALDDAFGSEMARRDRAVEIC